MSDPAPAPPPRVLVTLPGGTVVRGVLHHREQDTDGTWTYTVAIPVPATACEPVPGEDYTHVPTTRAGETGDWLLQQLPGGGDDPRVMLHTAGCWAAEGRLTRVSTVDAKDFVRHGWSVECTNCHATP